MRAWRRGCWSDRIRELRTLREQARREQQARRYGLPDLSEVADTDRREFVQSAQAPQTHRGGSGGSAPRWASRLVASLIEDQRAYETSSWARQGSNLRPSSPRSTLRAWETCAVTVADLIQSTPAQVNGGSVPTTGHRWDHMLTTATGTRRACRPANPPRQGSALAGWHVRSCSCTRWT